MVAECILVILTNAQIATVANSVLKTDFLLQMVRVARATTAKVVLSYPTLLVKVTVASVQLVITVQRALQHHLHVHQEPSTTKRKVQDLKIVNRALVDLIVEVMPMSFQMIFVPLDITVHAEPTHLDRNNTRTCRTTVVISIPVPSTLSIKPVISAPTVRIALSALPTQPPVTEENIATSKDWKLLSGTVRPVITAITARYQQNRENAGAVTTVRKELLLNRLVRSELSILTKENTLWNTATTVLLATIALIPGM